MGASSSYVHRAIGQRIRDAERAAAAGDYDESTKQFIKAGDLLVRAQEWRDAVRCYRSAIELDVVAARGLPRLLGIGDRTGEHADWRAYAEALVHARDWPAFGCRGARTLTSDHGTLVECLDVGPVLEVTMTAHESVEAVPDGRFATMPLAMALLILRRAFFLPYPHGTRAWRTPKPLRVQFRNDIVLLDHAGHWTRP